MFKEKFPDKNRNYLFVKSSCMLELLPDARQDPSALGQLASHIHPGPQSFAWHCVGQKH